MEGKQAEARMMLMNAVRLEPKNEQAWVALAQCVNLDSQKRDCFRQVLRINPNHEFARSEIERLGPPTVIAHVPEGWTNEIASERSCPYCGALASAEALFCQRCGREIATQPGEDPLNIPVTQEPGPSRRNRTLNAAAFQADTENASAAAAPGYRSTMNITAAVAMGALGLLQLPAILMFFLEAPPAFEGVLRSMLVVAISELLLGVILIWEATRIWGYSRKAPMESIGLALLGALGTSVYMLVGLPSWLGVLIVPLYFLPLILVYAEKERYVN
jgi:hypothetical protein